MTESFSAHHFGFALASDAGGIDEAEEVALALDDLVDGVAGGAGDGRNDGPFGIGKGVEQGGFADVGAADDGDLGFARFVLTVRALLADRLLYSVWIGVVEIFLEWLELGWFKFVFKRFGFFFGRGVFFVFKFRLVGGVAFGQHGVDGVEEVADAGAVFRRKSFRRCGSRGGRKFSAAPCCSTLSILLTARKTGLPPRISRRGELHVG